MSQRTEPLDYECPFMFKPKSLKTEAGFLNLNLLSLTFTIICLFNWHIEDEWPRLLVLLDQTQFKDSLGEKHTQGARDAEREESPSSTLKLWRGVSALTLIPPLLKSSRLKL